MNVLIGFEESQEVTKAFSKLGHEAYSCDLKPCSGGHPEWHLQMDIYEALGLKDWDFIGIHPECTKLAVSGNGTYGAGKIKNYQRIEAISFTIILWGKVKSIAKFAYMENPVGVLSKIIGNPQYIQPWQFGHGETKKTGLWLHNLPDLKPTNIVEGREQKIWKMSPGPKRSELRSKTYPGIAKAMANQWGKLN